MSKRIPESKWIWLGYPQHFICANDCRFRMATVVGSVVVSTVGDLHRKTADGTQEDDASEIGGGERSFYETYVFRVDGMAPCGCCAHITDLCEIWGRRTPDAVAAQKVHMDACRQFAAVNG
jgi:hypothetical protein